jgi:hypothetical protein
LQLQPGKCEFAQPKVEYLGYVVSRNSISASPGKVQAVQKYPVPKNAKDVRSFIGLASFYRRLIPKFAETAKPLTELLRKEFSFKWESRQQAAFDRLKEALCSDQDLAFPDFGTQFILTTDGSNTAVAAILSQEQDGVEGPIAYASRQLNRAKANSSASELELLAVTCATKHFTCYIFGKCFVIRTDHSALKYLRNFADNISGPMRWSLLLAEYEFQVQHRPGTKIRHVDALGRHVQAVTTARQLSTDVREEQRKDKYCNNLKTGKAEGRMEYFRDDEGVVYKRRKNGEPQLVVQRSIVKDVMYQNHDLIFASHPGEGDF